MKPRPNPLLRATTLAVSLVLCLNFARGADLYWDTNDSAAGAGTGTGTWGSDDFWTSDPLGLTATGSYIANSDVLFSAGAGAGTFTVSVASGSNQQASSLAFQEGNTTLTGSSSPFITLTGTGGNITVHSGASAILGAGSSLTLAGTTGLTKLGAGTFTLSGFSQNNFSGGVRVNEGTLALDFASLPNPYSDLIHNGNALSLGGGTLSMLGRSNAVVSSQTFAGTTIHSGLSRILVTNGSGGTSANLTLGTLSRGEAGGVLNLSLGTAAMGTTVSATEKILVSGPTGRWLGMWAFSGDPSTASARWVYVDATSQLRVNNGVAAGTNMASVTSESNVYTVAAGTNTLAGNRQAQGLQIANSNPGTVAIGANTLTTSGIMNINSGGTWNFTRTGAGGITVGTENELVIAGGGNVTISAPIANKAASNSSVTHTGGGTLTLGSINTYSGQTTVNSGIMAIGTGGSINSSSGIRINGGKFVQSNTATAITPLISLVGGSSGGTIDGTGTINSVIVSDLAANKITNGNGSTTALTIGNLTFSGDGSIDVRTAGSAGLNVTGTLATTPANGQVLVNVLTSPGWITGNTYNLISYGTFSGAITDFTKGSIFGLGARQSSDLVLSGSNIAMAISGDSALWTGAASGAWTTDTVGTPFNWKTLAGNTDTEFLPSDDVVFNDAAAITVIDITTANVSPNSVIFNNSTKNYTISSSGGFGIASGTLTKNGTGTVSLTTANTYTGTTTINGGTLQISGGNAIANTSLVTLANTAGATFQVLGSESIGALSGGGATGGNVTIEAGQTLTLFSGTQTYAGTISGSGTLTSSGAIQTLSGAISTSGGVNLTTGRLALGGDNSYTGQTAVSTGAGIIVTANNALGAGGIGNETVLSGVGGAISGAIGLSGGINYTTNEKIVGAGIGNTSANGVFSAVQRGLIQSVSGNNTFAGDIEINSAGFTRFGTQTGAGIGLTLSGTITATSGAQILIRAGDTDGNFVTLSGTGNSWNTDIHVYTGNNNASESAGLRLGAHNALATGASVAGATASLAATTFDMAGFNQTLNGLVTNSQLKLTNSNGSQQSTLTLNLTADKGTNTTRIQDGAGSIRLVKQGNFTQVLSGTQNYSGTTTIEAGRLLFGQTASLYNGIGANWTKENLIVNSGATLGLRVGGNGEFTAADVATIVGNLTTGINHNGLQGGSLLDLEINAATTYPSILADSTGSGSGSLGLVKTGGSGLTLDQDNTFSGGIALDDGYLYAGHNNAFGSGIVTIGTGAERLALQNGVDVGNNITINGGGTAFNGIIQNLNAAAGENATVSGNISITANAASGGHFASQGTGSILTLSGSISSSVKVVQRAGIVVFSGGGSYTELGIGGTTRLGANNGLATNAIADLGVSINGVLDLAGYNQSLVGITKNANAAAIGNSSTTTDSTLTLTGTSSYAGVIQNVVGSGSRMLHLAMNGAGETLSLSGTNTYSGDTTITQGTLALVDGGSINHSAVIDVQSSGTLSIAGVTTSTTIGSAAAQTLKGLGSVDLGAKTMIIGGSGTLAPGASPGTLEFITSAGGKLDFASGSTVTFDLGTLSDLITFSTVGDWLNGSGNATLSLDLLDGFSYANTYTVFQNVNTAGFTFASITGYDTGAYTANFEQSGNDYNLSFTVIPEPRAALLGGFGALMLLRRRRALHG
jgi:autotransporter-associated beta strand protein